MVLAQDILFRIDMFLSRIGRKLKVNVSSSVCAVGYLQHGGKQHVGLGVFVFVTLGSQ